MSEIKMSLITQVASPSFKEFIMKKRSERTFIKGALSQDSSIELFVDNILDHLQWVMFEVWHIDLDYMVEKYFGLFIRDLTDTIFHEFLHSLDRAIPEEQVSKTSELVKSIISAEVISSEEPNLIILN